MNTAKVTRLSDHRSTVQPPVDNTRLQALSRRFLDQLPGLLDSFFSKADDFLFEWAEKTNDGLESAAYFEHLRALRLEKDAVRRSVLSTMKQRVEQQLNGRFEDAGSGEAELGTELSLMGDETLERSLAIDSFSNRVIEQSSDDWLAFRERLGVLIGKKELRDENTPFNARALGSAMFDGLSSIECPLKTVLMLFRLFDKQAGPKLVQYYQASNRWLVEEGILPNLKLIHGRGDSSDNGQSHTLEQLSQLLAQRNAEPSGSGPAMGGFSGHSGGARGMMSGGYAGGYGGSAGSGGSGIQLDASTLDVLLGSLSQIQMQAAPATRDVAELKRWTHAQASAITSQAAGFEDSGTISLVAMLFEYILDDEKLSSHMKQLMARMQIPIIKVALLDKHFFTDTHHSARLLLNRMARAASGWEPDAEIDDDALLEGMEGIVVRLNQEFETDLTLFDEALAEFNTLYEQYKNEQDAHLEPLKAEEDSKYEEHQKQDRARLFMDALLADETPPMVVRTLLEKHWYRVMKAIFRQHGEGKSWKNSARIARELLWSVQANVQVSQAERFRKVAPAMLNGLRDGLKAIGVSEADRSSWIEAIQDLHQIERQPLNEDVWEAQAKLDAFEEKSAKADTIIEAPAPLPVDEPVVQHKPADLTYYMDRVDELEEGVWFEIEVKEGRMERGCLSHVVGARSKFVFTNYKGDRIAERSAIGLAMALRNDSIRPLDDAPLFDRVIDSIVQDIKPQPSHH
ncbi:MAG: DUF1631 domain-containing protein [Saccharospirillum sp.]|nr:DUF1631 domain-containing protein [Saccharospirillum sp.]